MTLLHSFLSFSLCGCSLHCVSLVSLSLFVVFFPCVCVFVRRRRPQIEKTEESDVPLEMLSEEDQRNARTVRYNFGSSFLDLRNIATLSAPISSGSSCVLFLLLLTLFLFFPVPPPPPAAAHFPVCLGVSCFSPFFLLRSLEFKIGPEPLNNFRMIERHYFRDELVKSFDFSFPFCMPLSVNTYEALYDVPELSSERSSVPLPPPPLLHSLCLFLLSSW